MWRNSKKHYDLATDAERNLVQTLADTEQRHATHSLARSRHVRSRPTRIRRALFQRGRNPSGKQLIEAKVFQRQIATSVGFPCRWRQCRNTPLAGYLMVSPHLHLRTLIETRDSDVDRMNGTVTDKARSGNCANRKCWRGPEFKKQVISDPKGTLERPTGQKLPTEMQISFRKRMRIHCIFYPGGARQSY